MIGIKKALGAKNAAAFDLAAACSGFIYALATANGLLQSGLHKKALVIGADLLSKFTDWKDRSNSGAVFVSMKPLAERTVMSLALGWADADTVMFFIVFTFKSPSSGDIMMSGPPYFQSLKPLPSGKGLPPSNLWCL